MLRYLTLSRSAGNKKFVSTSAVADYGDSQALFVPGSTPFRKNISICNATLVNRSGSAVVAGLAGRLLTTVWEAGTVTAAGVLTSATAAAQNATTGDFTLHNKADSGSGFLVGADIPFNIIGLVQSTAGDQVTPTKILEYWNGSAWTDITSSLLISDTLIAGGTGEKVLCWTIPSNWVVGGTGTGVNSARFNVRIRHTTGGAGTASPVASQLFVGRAEVLVPSIPTNNWASLIRSDTEYFFPPQCDALFPVFSVASYSNYVDIDIREY